MTRRELAALAVSSVGALMLCAGLAAIYRPLGLVVAGLAVLAAGLFLVAVDSTRAKP